MTHKIQAIKTLDNFVLLATFNNGVEKQYDMKQLYNAFPQFRGMDNRLFQQVRVDVGGYGISWNDDLDLDAEELWDNGIGTGKQIAVDVLSLLAANLSETRECVGITQKQLAEKTGIYQADISKIERGIGNPSISTLKRLADGMGVSLNIGFSIR